MGQGRDGRGQQPDQELCCSAVVSMVAHGVFGFWIGIPEFWAVSRSVSGAWVGASAICGSSGIDVFYLCWNVVAVGGAGALLPSASGEHGRIYLHSACGGFSVLFGFRDRSA